MPCRSAAGFGTAAARGAITASGSLRALPRRRGSTVAHVGPVHLARLGGQIH